jgi:hypothetical protein
MPLEALYKLMKEQRDYMHDKKKKPEFIINGYETGRTGPNRPDKNLVVASKNAFDGNPNGIDKTKIGDDVLGFCSLVLSYAKAAYPLQEGESPKLLLTYMPRTDFNTMFDQVKSQLPGDLFKLMAHLACFKTQFDRQGRLRLM